MKSCNRLIPVAAIASLALLSCRSPLNDQMLLHVQDSIAPEVQVISPTDGSSYASAVWVEGTAYDSSRTTGDNQGSIVSLYYQVLATSLGGKVSVENGRFSFVFSTETLTGNNITLLIIAVDWNRNTSEVYLSLVYRGNDIPSFSAVSGNRGITLSWDPVPGAESYILYYTKDGSYPNLPVGSNGFALSGVQPGFLLDTYRHDGNPTATDRVKNGRMHVFQLRAVFPAASGMQDSWSDYVKAIPLSPLTLAPKVSKDEVGKIELWWHDIPADVGYLVYRAESKAGPYYQLTGTLTQAQFTDRSVSDGVTYYYRIKPEHYSSIESYPMPGKTSVLEFSPKVGSLSLGTGYPGAVVVADAKAYLGTTYGGLNIVNVANPSQPSLSGSLDYGGSTDTAIGGIALKGDYAYLAAHMTKVKVIGINPASPDYLQAIGDLEPQGAHEAVVYGNELYCTNYNWLYLYDVTNPAAPVKKGQLGLYALTYNNRLFLEPRGATRRLYICGGYTDNMGVDIIDVDPATPAFTRVATYTMAAQAQQVQVAGNYAYIASSDGIRVVNVAGSVPSFSPSYTFAASQQVSDLVLVGNTLYALVVNKGLYRYRIPDLAQPEGMLLERIYDQVPDGRLCITSNYAYVSNPSEGSGGLSVIYVGDELFDLSDRPVFTFSEYGGYQSVTDMEMYGDLCFATVLGQGLETLRLTPPASFQHLGSYKTGAALNPLGVKAVGERVFLADGGYGLHILNVVDPSAPKELGGLAATHCGRLPELNFCQLGLDIVGDYAFLPGFDGGILVADVSDPQHPEKLTVIPMISDTIEVQAQGSVLYAAAYSSGLFAIDITEPEAPQILSSYFEGGYAMGLDVEGATVYLAAFHRAVDIINYSNPARPVREGRYEWPDPLNWGWLVVAMDVDAVRNYAYVARYENSILVLDISDPRYPFPQGSYPGSPYQRKTATLLVRDDYVHAVGIESTNNKPAWMMYHLRMR
jgi:hypothetical protein